MHQIPVDDLTKIGLVAQQMKKCAAAERATATDGAVARCCPLGDDALFGKVAFKRVDRAELEVARKDVPDAYGLGRLCQTNVALFVRRW